jgi:hypothetical protein
MGVSRSRASLLAVPAHDMPTAMQAPHLTYGRDVLGKEDKGCLSIRIHERGEREVMEREIEREKV